MNKFLTIIIIIIPIFLSCSKEKKKTIENKNSNSSKSPAQTLTQPDSKKPVIVKPPVKSKISCEILYERHGTCFVPKHKKTYNIPIANSAIKGPSDALVTIVEFSDTQCPGCKYWSLKILPALLKKHPDVRLAFKHFPLDFHQMATNGAMALEEVKKQRGDSAFWKLHDFLFSNQDAFSLDFFMLQTKDKSDKDLVENIKKFKTFLKTIKIDIKKFKKAMVSETHLSKVENDKKTANTIGVNQTPQIYINGRVLQNNENIEDVILLMKKKALVMVKNGTKKSEIYKTIIKNKKLVDKTELPKQRRLEILNKFKLIFIPKCKKDPQIKPLIDSMKKCSSKTIECKTFQNCVETKINSSSQK
jgi:protein-disulfide isomerase